MRRLKWEASSRDALVDPTRILLSVGTSFPHKHEIISSGG